MEKEETENITPRDILKDISSLMDKLNKKYYELWRMFPNKKQKV